MVVGDVLQLIQFVKNALDKRGELNKESAKSYFDQFMVPTWDAFGTIHEGYKAAFRAYATRLTGGHSQIDRTQLKSVSKEMAQDWDYTADSRSKLQAMMAHLPASRTKGQDEAVTGFVNAITTYFANAEICYKGLLTADSKTTDQHTQRPTVSDRRTAFKAGMLVGSAILPGLGTVIGGVAAALMTGALSSNIEHEMLSGADVKGIFDARIAALQTQYDAVANAFYQLKAALLA